VRERERERERERDRETERQTERQTENLFVNLCACYRIPPRLHIRCIHLSDLLSLPVIISQSCFCRILARSHFADQDNFELMAISLV
jgi:hypothetical protein